MCQYCNLSINEEEDPAIVNQELLDIINPNIDNLLAFEEIPDNDEELMDTDPSWTEIVSNFNLNYWQNESYEMYTGNILRFSNIQINDIFSYYYPDFCGPIMKSAEYNYGYGLTKSEFLKFDYQDMPTNFFFYQNDYIHLRSHACIDHPELYTRKEHHFFLYVHDAYYYIRNNINNFFCPQCDLHTFFYDDKESFECDDCMDDLNTTYGDFNYKFENDYIQLMFEFQELHTSSNV
jgi:hypothetical protein